MFSIKLVDILKSPIRYIKNNGFAFSLDRNNYLKHLFEENNKNRN